MFLWVCVTKQPTRQITQRFGRGLGTVSHKMGEVADAMYSFAQTAVAVKDPKYRKIHPRFDEFRPYFDGCIGLWMEHTSKCKLVASHGWTS